MTPKTARRLTWAAVYLTAATVPLSAYLLSRPLATPLTPEAVLSVGVAFVGALASAVVGALIRRGVAGSRLVAHGFGPTRPVAPNDTAAGREKNRRVEFRVIQRKIAGEVVDVER